MISNKPAISNAPILIVNFSCLLLIIFLVTILQVQILIGLALCALLIVADILWTWRFLPNHAPSKHEYAPLPIAARSSENSIDTAGIQLDLGKLLNSSSTEDYESPRDPLWSTPLAKHNNPKRREHSLSSPR